MEAGVRDHYFDNLKGILIILVVLGHTLELFPVSSVTRFAYLLIYSFHMPLFVFCTGYFSVGAAPGKVLRTILYPYFVWQTIYYLFYVYVLKIDGTVLSYTTPTWLLWYLFSCLLWFLLRPLFQAGSNRGALLSVSSALALGILAGFDLNIHRYLALSRTLVFFPFYLAGYFLHTRTDALLVPENLETALGRTFSRVPVKWQKISLSVAVIAVAVGGAACLALLQPKLDPNWFYEADGYTHPKQWIFRLCHYALAAAMSLVLMRLTPKKRGFLSTIGENSMPVFLLHGLLVRWLNGRVPAFVLSLPAVVQFLASLGFALAVCLLFGNGAVKKALSPLLRFSAPSRSDKRDLSPTL